MRASYRLALLLPLVFCGCTATGFDRAALQERLKDGSFQMPDSAIAEARSLKPQLRFPCRIAVSLQPEGHDWRWTPEDKSALEACAGALKKDGIAADVFPLPELLAGGKSDLKELRLAAAKCGADVLLVVRGAAQTDSYKNFAAVFNLTLVGGFVVPGSHRDSLFVLEGVLVDVDNGYVYTGVQAEGVGKIVRPTFVIEDKDAIAKAKAQAVAQFGDEFLKRMRRLKVGPAFISDVNPPPAVLPTPAPLGAAPQSPPVFVSDINRKGVTVGLTPAGTFAPDLDVPIRRDSFERVIPNAGGVMTGITAPRPQP